MCSGTGNTVMVLHTLASRRSTPTPPIASADVPVTTSAPLPVESSALRCRIPVISWGHRTAGAQVMLRENHPLFLARVAIARDFGVIRLYS